MAGSRGYTYGTADRLTRDRRDDLFSELTLILGS
jgi:hypothetical protein